MNELSTADYEKMIEGAKLLEEDGHGPKVYLTTANQICKLFRCKRTFSSAKYYPYAQRFADNADCLLNLNIPCVTMLNVFRLPHIDRDLVHYEFLEGETLRDVLKESYSDELLQKTAVFIAHLHSLGVYFRSLHFGNIIVLPSGELGLIDVSDMKIKSRALGVGKRVRNFKAFMRYEIDMDFITRFGFSNFTEVYLKESDLTMNRFMLSLTLQPKHPALALLKDQ
jgi:serine/threonine protein kinase